MANVNAPFGLRYVSRADGAEPNYAIQTRQIFYTDANKIGYGDPLKTLGATAGPAQGTLDISGTNSQVAGVFLGCNYVDSILGYVERPSWSAPSTAVQGSVNAKYIPDTSAVFEIQVGNLTSSLPGTSIGLNAAFGTTVGLPNSAGFSVAYLDGATVATTNTLPLRIIGFSTGFFNGAQNDPTTAYPVVQVTFNVADYNTTTGV